MIIMVLGKLRRQNCSQLQSKKTGGPFGGVPKLDLPVVSFLFLSGRMACIGASHQILKFFWEKQKKLQKIKLLFGFCRCGFHEAVAAVLIIFGFTFALFYHLSNGIRHLFWDAGYGYDLNHAYISGVSVIISSLLLTSMTWLIVYLRVV